MNFDIICRHCGKKNTISRKGKLSKQNCSYCGHVLIDTEHEKTKAVILCGNCNSLNLAPAFGWKKIRCKSCGFSIPHPVLSTKGGRADRGVKYAYMLTIKCSTETKSDIERLSKQMNTTQGAITRYLLKISLDRIQ